MLSRRGRSASPGDPLCNDGVSVIETPKGRKKFSFKEPEIMGFLGFRRMSLMGRARNNSRPPQLQQVRSKSLQPPAKPKSNNGDNNNRSREMEELESQAMRVVRTVGQAFEVCHKLSLNNPPNDEQQQQRDKDRIIGDGEQQRSQDDTFDERDSEFASLQPSQPSPSSVHKDILLLGDAEDSILDQPCPLRQHHDLTNATQTANCPASPLRQSPLGNAISEQLMNSELTALKHEIQLLRERLDQQSQQTRAAVAHARLLQDQLAAETAARVEAQARTHQLLVQNKELLEHIAALVSHLREHERISGVPLTGQPGQITNAGTLNQGTTVADITGLGQYNTSWDHHTHGMYLPLEPTSLYYPNPLGFPRPSSSASNCNDEQQLMRYQNQLWDNLRSVASPYTTSLYQNVPIPNHHYGPAFTLPPTGRPRSAQPPLSPLSPSSTLPRPSRIRRSQNYQQQNSSQRSRSLDRPRSLSESVQEPSFIKPLPCKCQNSSPTKNNSPLPLRNNLHDLMRPLVLDPPPVGHSKAVQTETCYRQNNNPVILLTQSESNKNGDSMPKIVESEDDCSDEERLDFVSELPRLLRRNSQ